VNRWKFIASLFGFGALAKAQQPLGVVSFDQSKMRGAWEDKPPKRGQCPVCGTMSKPYKPSEIHGSVTCARDPGWDGDGVWACSQQLQVRCARCNVSFWQDAEPTNAK
jgi:hypothetical protein